MMPPHLPLLLIIEGENDIHFLTAISAMLHRDNAQLPDLAQLVAEHRIMFLPTGGSNITQWALRLRSLQKLEFYLLDREIEPETSIRKRFADRINLHPCCFSVMTTKRAVENYLHPIAIREACGIDLTFDDNTDVAGLLALKLMQRSGQPFWAQLPSKRQRRLHDKAKKILNVKAVQLMTPVLLAEQDPQGEIIRWFTTIKGLIDAHS